MKTEVHISSPKKVPIKNLFVQNCIDFINFLRTLFEHVIIDNKIRTNKEFYLILFIYSSWQEMIPLLLYYA